MAAAALTASAFLAPARAEPGDRNDIYDVIQTYSSLSGAPAPSRQAVKDATRRGSAARERRAGEAAPAGRNAYSALIARHAAAAGVPYALADAVVRIESRYNPRATNGGAVGLMQIKPQTARGLGYSGGAAGLMNPDTNLRYGMLYLAQAYRMSGGNTCATVMRYQSGHYAKSFSGANRAYCAKARMIMASND